MWFKNGGKGRGFRNPETSTNLCLNNFKESNLVINIDHLGQKMSITAIFCYICCLFESNYDTSARSRKIVQIEWQSFVKMK